MLYKDIIASGTGTVCAELCMIPLCTVKVNYQTDLNYKSVFDATKDIYAKRGIYGFYNASFYSSIAQLTSITTKYTLYEAFKKFRNGDNNSYTTNILCGLTSGIIGSLLTHPLDVLKIHKQINKPFLPEYRTVGAKLLYRGYSKNVTKTVMLSSLLFPTNDLYKKHIDSTVLAAAATSATITTVIQPIDYLKTRHIANQKLWQGWNIKNYYRGFGINLSRTLPHFTILMTVADFIKKKLN